MEMTPGAKKVSAELCSTPCSGGLGDNCGRKGVAMVYTNKKKHVK